MEINLKGKVALITGGARGIGRDVSLALGRAGAQLVVCGTNAEILTQFEKELQEAKIEAICTVANVTDLQQVEEVVRKALDKFGRIDILINNAGITRDNLVARMSTEEWDDVLSVNLKGAYQFIKTVSRPMIKQRFGRVVNITSVIGLIGNAGQANYAASKAGLIGLTKSVARELSSRNVTVNAVAPGFIETEMTAKLSDALKQEMQKRIPLGRLGQSVEVAQAVLFLVSDMAAYITGQVLVVDGGMVM
jgi:3-oxoacyl-[acyl-carrier protein] reductase